jgi:toxin ParE1/3/4
VAQVTWTDQALDDLDAICRFIARDAPGYATLCAERVFQATDRLAQFSRVGRVVSEVGRDDIRGARCTSCAYTGLVFVGGDKLQFPALPQAPLGPSPPALLTNCHASITAYQHRSRQHLESR